MSLKNTDIFGRKVFFIAPSSLLIPSSFMEELCTLGYEAHIVDCIGNFASEQVKKITENFPDALIFFNIDSAASEGTAWPKFIWQIRQENADIAVGVVFEATSKERERQVEAEQKSNLSADCIPLYRGKDKENFDSILSALEKCGAKGRRNNIRAKCNDESCISFKHGSLNFRAKLDDVNISHICCIAEGNENIRDLKIYDKIRDAHINVNGLEFTSDIVLIMKRVKMGVSTAIFMFIKEPDDEPGLEAEMEKKLNKKIYEITSEDFARFFNK